MSNLHLPAEILDHIVDHLHDTEDTLRNCCLVSKSWIPRTRKHLFADIRFHLVRDVLSWKRTFPDPTTSPAHHARILFIDGFAVIAAAEAEADGCIGSFSRVTGSEAGADRTEPDFDQSAAPLAPFHGFSPIIKSLWVVVPTLPLSQVFNLIFSFPLLEDLDVTLVEQYSNNRDGSNEDKMPTATQPPSPPMFTGSLELCLSEEMEPFTRRLLSLPGGIHFRNLTLTWLHEEDHLLTTALVEGCSHTLETLDIDWNLVGESRTGFVDLAKATKLREVVFRPNSWSVEWITTALQTITAKHRDLQQISIRMCYPIVHKLSGAGIEADVREEVGEAGCREWLELDRLLVQLWESRRIHLMAVLRKGQDMRSSFECLLPEITKRGMIDVVECD